MRRTSLTIATTAGGILAGAVIGLAAPSSAAVAQGGDAVQTIKTLQAAGYNVIVNKTGNAPLAQADVVAIRPGQDVIDRVAVPGDSSEARLRYTTVYVDVR